MCIADFEDALIVTLMIGNVIMLGVLVMSIKVFRNEKRFHYAMFPESKKRKS